MAQVIRWGILGCGKIARKFASDLQLVNDAQLVSIASRNPENGQAFATDFAVKNIHTTYEGLATDEEVDVIYIATPHNLHFENTMLCLKHRKAVLCEKPFAINARQSAQMIALAQQQHVFLMEALWSKFLPHYQMLQQYLQQGRLGKITSVLINFGFKPVPPYAPRIFEPSLAGGTMMDIGIYNVFFALSVLGKPDIIDAVMTPAYTGVDEQCAVTFRYNNGAIAQLFSSFSSNLSTEADINGTEGRIHLTNRFYAPGNNFEYYSNNADGLELIPIEKEAGFGYQYEARHVGDCLRKGLTESPIMGFADTMLLIETLDAIRAKAGIVYDADKI